MTLIEVKNLSKNYKIIKKRNGIIGACLNIISPNYNTIEAVKNISFNIDKGESVGFIGPNGAGKSTTVKMLTGILIPSGGYLTIDGIVPFKKRKEFVKNIGVVFGQRTQLWWDLPVSDTFELLKFIYKINDKTYKKNLDTFNNILSLNDFFNQPVRQLSLGQRMRAEIAASLLHDPDCIFFDEPTIGLDIVAKEKIREFIKFINSEKKITVLFTTHDMQDIEKICKRIIIIDKGIKIYDGDIETIKNKYSKERKITAHFNNPYDLNNLPYKVSEISKKNNYKWEIIVNINEVKISKLINYLSSNYNLSDITINETEIEEIIREIYLKGMY